MSGAEKKVKQIGRSLDFGPNLKRIGRDIEKSSDVKRLDPTRSARNRAKAARAGQLELVGRQRQKEELRLAEAEDVIGRRRLLSRTGGRQSLIASR
jgi:hypothetical protein